MIEALTTLPDGLSVVVFWSIVAASFATSMLTAALGIGGGALLLAILASLLPGAALIPVHGVVQLGSNAGRAALMFQHIHWPALGSFSVGTLIGAVLGGAVAVELPGPVVQAGVGLFVIYTVLAKAPKWISRWPWLTGGVSSFLTMFFGATGLFVAGFTKSLGLQRLGHVATHGALMTVQHGLKVLVFGLFGFAFGPWLGVIGAMILSGLAGTYAGRSVLQRTPEAWFKTTLDALLILISLRLIWGAAVSAGWI